MVSFVKPEEARLKSYMDCVQEAKTRFNLPFDSYGIGIAVIESDPKAEPYVPLKVRGRFVPAESSIVPPKMRAMVDDAACLIAFDSKTWDLLDHPKRIALCHHQLLHFLVSDKMDKKGRFKVSLRKHDFEVGVFREVIQEHGRDCVEGLQIMKEFVIHDKKYMPLFDNAKFDVSDTRAVSVMSSLHRIEKEAEGESE